MLVWALPWLKGDRASVESLGGCSVWWGLWRSCDPSAVAELSMVRPLCWEGPPPFRQLDAEEGCGSPSVLTTGLSEVEVSCPLKEACTAAACCLSVDTHLCRPSEHVRMTLCTSVQTEGCSGVSACHPYASLSANGLVGD